MSFFYIVEQNGDLCSVSGYAFPTVLRALDSAAKRIGSADDRRTVFTALRAVVKEDDSPPSTGSKSYACFAVHGRSTFCVEGHMTLIAEEAVALSIARCLSRRNGDAGRGVVLYSDLSPLPEETSHA